MKYYFERVMFVATGKTEMVKIISDKTGISQKQVSECLNAFTETVTEKLAEGDKIQLTGFGTFMTRKRESREGRNPGTGEKITIPAGVTPVFKAGKVLKEKVNG